MAVRRMRPVAAFTRARPIMSPWCLALLGTRLEQRRLGELPRGIRKRIAARRYEASRSSSNSVIMLPLAERCGKVMRDALSTQETPRAGPSEAAERSRSVGIVLKLQERHSGARSLNTRVTPHGCFPAAGGATV